MDEKKSTNENGVDESRYSMETRVIYGKNISKKWDYAHHVTAPLTSSVIFRLDSVERGAEGFSEFANPNFMGEESEPIYIYDRLGEPNKDLLEENLAFIENGETAVCFSTGMGAISAVLGILTKSGDEIISHRTLYGCTFSLLNNWYPKFNIKNTPVDLTDLEAFRDSMSSATRVVYFETPANPSLDIIDIHEIKSIIDEFNEKRPENEKIYIVVDNTFATPYCQRPINFGADFVVHSLTKGIGGFGTDMGGVVIGAKKYRDLLLLFRKDYGAVLATKAAWTILTYGLPTLPLRIAKQISNARSISEFLVSHSKVELVNYPGLPHYKYHPIAQKQMRDFNNNFAPGSLIFFSLKGKSPEEKRNKGKIFMNYAAKNAYTMTLAVSLGHTRTLIEHPASMTHSVIPADKILDYGIDPGGIRIAVGIENVNDLIYDLEKCLKIV
ncbi:MAG: aminotransferase class I/II-fold pyridoxal phosphate-dependent enzyme [Ignavibacteriaceae bacterium]|jgi:cystathionine beta-lyase/cystathionine gamma-synthase|nr:aminotransferase class I/II-fold pyridoxal phosphate-dependent enzyme [Ignavibacteriaceae bacterium]